MASYRYHVQPFIGHVTPETRAIPQAVAAQLKMVIDQYAVHGWEFHSVETITIQVQPGCLGSLLGQRVSYMTYDQIIFRQPIS